MADGATRGSGRLGRVVRAVVGSRAYAAWQRYAGASGNVLAGGAGYYALFSIVPALTLAFTIFGSVLSGRPDLLRALGNYLNELLPGMIRTADNPEGLIVVTMPQSTTLTLAGLISVGTLVVYGIGWVGALRVGIRAMFGLPPHDASVVRARARDLAVLLGLGLAITVSAVLTAVVGGAADQIARLLGLGDSGGLVTLVGLALGVTLDTLLMVVLLRFASGIPLPWPAVRAGALLGGTALTGLKLAGGYLVGRVSGNPLLGALAVTLGIVFWLNLMSRVVLMGAAWAAQDAEDLATPERPPTDA